jgi:hypothetical protein
MKKRIVSRGLKFRSHRPTADRERFRVVHDWCLEIPETWRTESRRVTTRDSCLFDIQQYYLFFSNWSASTSSILLQAALVRSA